MDSAQTVEVSQAVPGTPKQVWEFLLGRDGSEIWLGPGTDLTKDKSYETANGTAGRVRKIKDAKQLSLTWQPKDWDHDSDVHVIVGDGTLKFRQEGLIDAAERAEQREYWEGVVERIATALAER
ncbi:SRPBCC domain-containing protein [Amycolatopsis sp. cg5]|uniref:SRPBCC domain-containing protein n=1 Tax=Amycolatopsis sp. cg5 TaxID=3238802 RepID=UPI003523FD82